MGLETAVGEGGPAVGGYLRHVSESVRVVRGKGGLLCL